MQLTAKERLIVRVDVHTNRTICKIVFILQINCQDAANIVIICIINLELQASGGNVALSVNRVSFNPCNKAFIRSRVVARVRQRSEQGGLMR